MIRSQKLSELCLISSLVIITILSGVDGFMYLPAFPEMIKYFNVEMQDITIVSRLQLMGLGIGCVFVGALSLAYGKKRTLLVGLIIFLIATITAALSTNFYVLIISCLFIGLSKSAPTVMCASIILDKYKSQAANSVILLVRIFSLPALILAPTIAGYIAHNLGWRYNFITVSIIVTIAFISSMLFINDTKEEVSARKVFSFRETFYQYKSLVTNFRYMANAIIMLFPSTIMTVYMNNVSVIFVSANPSLVQRFGVYGSILMLVTMLFSYISIKLAKIKGVDFVSKVGFIAAVTGTIILILFMIVESKFMQNNYIQLFGSSSLIICVAGMSMMNGYLIRAVEAAPEIKALAVSFLLTLNNIIDARAIFLSSVFFDDTLVPTCILVGIILTVVLYLNNKLQKKV